MLAAEAFASADFTHRRSRFALIRFSSATDARDTPGAWHAAIAACLKSWSASADQPYR